MCMDAATAHAFAELKTLLTQHEDASELRGNELCSMIAMLPEPAAWTGTVRVPWFGLFTITLRQSVAADHHVMGQVARPDPYLVQGGD